MLILNHEALQPQGCLYSQHLTEADCNLMCGEFEAIKVYITSFRTARGAETLYQKCVCVGTYNQKFLFCLFCLFLFPYVTNSLAVLKFSL